MAEHNLRLKDMAYIDGSLQKACGGAAVHGFFGSRGGVSAGIYESLNCAVGSRDKPECAIENRRRVQEALGADHLLSGYQEHSAQCIYVEQPWDMHVDITGDMLRTKEHPHRPRADGFVTDVPKVALGVLTADCAPVLLFGAKADGAPVIGAAHAGWGGAYKGILEATLKVMQERGADINAVSAAIGSCISKRSYEVGEEFLERFIEQDDENERFFMTAQRQGHYMFDLAGYVTARLAAAGVKNISICGHDTYAHEGEYFSYRRTCHRGESDYGRQISAIMIL